MAKKKYTVISLFSGGMGLDLGLHATGRFRLLACVEKEASFCQTIKHNIANGQLPGRPKVYEGDISELDPEKILSDTGIKPGELDLLVGGPPCQTFSTAGRRGTTQDPRGTLLWQFLRFVEAMRPRFFLMENVRGLVSAGLRHRPIHLRPDHGGGPLDPDEEPGSVIRLFSNDLQSISGAPYHMDIFEVNAVNYGAPQIRERVLFIGNRYNAEVDFPAPTHGNPEGLQLANGEHQLDLLERATQILPWRTLQDAIGDITDIDHRILDFSERKKRYLSLVPPGSNWRSLPKALQQESMGRAWHAKGGRSGWWRRLSFDLPCPTLVTLPNHASTSLCHPTETRALSVQEYARIQEFPDGWQFQGKLAEQYTQIGNAVPTRLGRVAGAVVADSLDALKMRHWRRYPPKKQDFRIVYLQSHVRTRRWFKDGQTLVRGGGRTSDTGYSPPKTMKRVRSISQPKTRKGA